jgi:hypothetical protein
MRLQLLASSLILPFAACVRTPEDIVPRPTDLTIQSAISQIQTAIVSAAERARATGQYSGYYPCTAQAVLNVTADAHNQDTLVLDASIKPPSPAAPSLSLSNTYGVSSNASVGNQVTVVLASSLCLPQPSPDNAGQTSGAKNAPTRNRAASSSTAKRASGAQAVPSATTTQPSPLPPPPPLAPPPPPERAPPSPR